MESGPKAGAVLLLLFASLSLLVFSGATQAADSQLAVVINLYEGQVATSILVFASVYGREEFWIAVLALMVALGKRETKILALELSLLFLVGIVAGELLKQVAFRPRPFEDISGIITRVTVDTDSSFPSGHALIVSIGAAFALVKFRKRVAVPLLLEAALVCYSRVYVGMHYPLDVLAGVTLGGAISLLGILLLERYALPSLFYSMGHLGSAKT